MRRWDLIAGLRAWGMVFAGYMPLAEHIAMRQSAHLSGLAVAMEVNWIPHLRNRRPPNRGPRFGNPSVRSHCFALVEAHIGLRHIPA